MPTLAADCPRCMVQRTTFDCYADIYVGVSYSWQTHHEVFSVCRHCHRSSIFKLDLMSSDISANFHKNGTLLTLKEISLNRVFAIVGNVTQKDRQCVPPPEHLPAEVAAVFQEASTCLAVGCINAAATMFRLSLDLATLPLIDLKGIKPNEKERRDLGLRLRWLFENALLPSTLKELASCVREDGNDAAHRGTLSQEDAQDLEDFSRALLERLFTEPKKLELREQSRVARRKGLLVAKQP